MNQTDTLPLQTRACVLTLEWLEALETVGAGLHKLRERGYNTVILPAFQGGVPLMPVDRRGTVLPKKTTTALGLLEMLAESDFTVWLYIDPLTAGATGGGGLGWLARRHQRWLAKNAGGTFECAADGKVPGLFCWTSIEFRRFIGNMLVTLAEGFPFDGVVLDLRRTPCPTSDPNTWMHLGYSSLTRLQSEIGLDIEQYLDQPALEQFRAVMDWRHDQLTKFVENIKARVRRVQSQVLFFVLGKLPPSGESLVPWMPSYREGYFEGAMLEADPEAFPAHFAALDRLSGVRRVILAALAREEGIAPLVESLSEVPSPGFAVLEPGQEDPTSMPPVAAHWDQSGAMEAKPTHAVQAILEHIAGHELDEETSTTLRQALSEVYPGWGSFHLQQAMDLRARLQKVRKEARDIPANLLREIELAERLLPLTPSGSEES